MEAITKHPVRPRLRPLRRPNLGRASWRVAPVAVVQAAAVLALARYTDLWPLATGLVLAVEWWVLQPAAEGRTARWLARVPAVLVGCGVVLTIATAPRLATQVAAAGLYAAWRIWWSREDVTAPVGLVHLLVVQAVALEGLFLAAAVWRTPSWAIIGLVWLFCYVSVYSVLSRRSERAAGVMAATWALIAAQISWVLLLWLFTYTMSGGYILVPQPALILTALAYCFGNIYVSQKDGTLSRGRLAEYMIIGLILVVVVIVGTSWRGGV